MKTSNQNTNQNKNGLASSPEQSGKQNLPRIDFTLRRVNRQLETDKLLALLRKETPHYFSIAEVVGKWVWIQFLQKQPAEVTRVLAQLGFHWNRKRNVWQHPCGTVSEPASYDPRKRYGSYFAAESQRA